MEGRGSGPGLFGQVNQKKRNVDGGSPCGPLPKFGACPRSEAAADETSAVHVSGQHH